jgi:hypothetical protein
VVVRFAATALPQHVSALSTREFQDGLADVYSLTATRRVRGHCPAVKPVNICSHSREEFPASRAGVQHPRPCVL